MTQEQKKSIRNKLRTLESLVHRFRLTNGNILNCFPSFSDGEALSKFIVSLDNDNLTDWRVESFLRAANVLYKKVKDKEKNES